MRGDIKSVVLLNVKNFVLFVDAFRGKCWYGGCDMKETRLCVSLEMHYTELDKWHQTIYCWNF